MLTPMSDITGSNRRDRSCRRERPPWTPGSTWWTRSSRFCWQRGSKGKTFVWLFSHSLLHVKNIWLLEKVPDCSAGLLTHSLVAMEASCCLYLDTHASEPGSNFFFNICRSWYHKLFNFPGRHLLHPQWDLYLVSIQSFSGLRYTAWMKVVLQSLCEMHRVSQEVRAGEAAHQSRAH